MGLVGTSLVTFGISLAGIVLNYMYYTGEYSGERDTILHSNKKHSLLLNFFTGQCKLHEFFISFNMLFCIALSVVSILPQVKHRFQPNKKISFKRSKQDFSLYFALSRSKSSIQSPGYFSLDALPST